MKRFLVPTTVLLLVVPAVASGGEVPNEADRLRAALEALGPRATFEWLERERPSDALPGWSLEVAVPPEEPFRLVVDWERAEAHVAPEVPLALPSVQLNEPRSGCVFTKSSGSVWVTAPVGQRLQTPLGPMGSGCPFQGHGWFMKTTTLACGLKGTDPGGENCFAFGRLAFHFIQFGQYFIFCTPSSGGLAVQQWPAGLTAKTPTCQIVAFGLNPAQWDWWVAACGASPGPGVAACFNDD